MRKLDGLLLQNNNKGCFSWAPDLSAAPVAWLSRFDENIVTTLWFSKKLEGGVCLLQEHRHEQLHHQSCLQRRA